MKKRVCRGYWNFKNILKIATKFSSLKEFRNNEPSVYTTACRIKIINKICLSANLSRQKKRPKYWTYERILKIAQKYNLFIDFRESEKSAYNAICDMGSIKKLTEEAGLIKNITRNRIPINYSYFTFQECYDLALSCSTKKEFLDKYKCAYQKAWRSGWLQKICQHMIPLSNLSKRGLYAFEHPDKSVYIGLTWNYKERYRHHMACNKILINKKNTIGQLFKTFDVFYKPKIAALKEIQLRNKYENQGWIILNKMKCGGLGSGHVTYTFKRCKRAAAKCKTIKEFYKYFPSEREAAQNKGWYKEITQHMPLPKNACKKILCIETGGKFNSFSQAARILGIHQTNISKFFKGSLHHVGGYTFKLL